MTKYEPVQRHRSPLSTKNNIRYSKYGIRKRYQEDMISKLHTGTTSQVSPADEKISSTEYIAPYTVLKIRYSNTVPIRYNNTPVQRHRSPLPTKK